LFMQICADDDSILLGRGPTPHKNEDFDHSSCKSLVQVHATCALSTPGLENIWT
jgi:hypothetical protein